MTRTISTLVAATALAACSQSSGPEGLAPAPAASTTVKYDFFHRPLPEIPLPNDLATRADRTSATGLRLNASMIAPTRLESRMRELVDEMDGWGVLQPIAIPFTGPLDVQSILDGHRDPDYATDNDVIYLINVDPDSPELGRVHHLDVGQGNYPSTLERPGDYGPNDPRGHTLSLLFEETDEDVNGNGKLDPGEDTDADGVLDVPNYLPGADPAPDDLAARADALMTFYERETNTLIVTPLTPLRERTTYAVVVTRRLLDEGGEPVGSPFPWINHTAQTQALRRLPTVLAPLGLDLGDVAYAFTFTTQTTDAAWHALRDGLYGQGVQRHLGEDFPPNVTELYPLRDAEQYPDSESLHLLYGEQWADGLRMVEEEVMEGTTDSYEQQLVIEGQRYVDYYVIGSFDAPQLFDRYDADGKWLPYNDQSWPPDLDRVPASARAEKIYFTLAVPRKEVSVRGQGKPAPVVILNHGHTGQRFTAMSWSAYFCKYGLAVLSIDGPSHGINVGPLERALVEAKLGELGLGAAATAVLLDRASDQNFDLVPDSGADFWTAYMFHTRDMVRQFTLDLMQTVRVIRGFDAVKTWALDTDGDGVADLSGLAGDFDGDGVIDIGGDAPITVSGGSLGGMMTMLLGALEPEVSSIVPIVGGGALATIGVRSTNGGAKVGFMIRAMSPMYVGTIDPESGDMKMETFVPNLIDDELVALGKTSGVEPGDTMVVENVANGQRGCGLVTPDGRVRAAVESDVGDSTRIVFYRGPVIVPGGECEVEANATVVATFDSFGERVQFQDRSFSRGESLVSLTEGLGLRRANPELRRMQGIGQMVLDPGDPAVYASHLQVEPMRYAATGTETGAHAVMLFTAGDTSVPNSAGMAVARAAGMLDYLEPDPRYGVPPNQVLIDHYIAEGVDVIPRYVDSEGNGVHIDIENLSGGDDVWAEIDLPRLDPPLRAGVGQPDRLGGESAALFALTDPHGDHGFAGPGSMIDGARARCTLACADGDEEVCGCAAVTTYDVGLFLVEMVARYLAADGAAIPLDTCQAHNDCTDAPALPAARGSAELQ